jgi:hypothetical protein
LTDQPHGGQPSLGPSAESTLLTLAVLFFVAVILSAITFIPRGGSADGDVASASDNSENLDAALGTSDGATAADAGSAAAAGAGGTVTRTGKTAAGTTKGGAGKAAAGPAKGGGGKAATGPTKGGAGGAGGTGGGGSGAGAGGGSGGGGALPSGGGGAGGTDGYLLVDCDNGAGGATDTGVTDDQILLGAVTVESGPGASFLQPEGVAMQAVASKVNNAGGICGRDIKLKLHDSGWDAQTGFRYIQNLVEGDKVFALVVVPDSEGLDAASSAGYLESKKVPVIGTDGLLYSQYQDPYIWPIAASTVTAMHAMALSQYSNGARNFSLVYETTYRFGREGANAYNRMVKAKTGSDIPGYSDPDKNPQCKERFCGIVANQQGYGSAANTINTACGGDCDAGAVLLEPTTAITWFASGGRFGGVVKSQGGSGAAPQPLFDSYFANGCQTACDHMRLWTGFLPPTAHFNSQPGVLEYTGDMTSYSPNVDVANQFAEGAYLGMRLAVDAIAVASVSSGGLKRSTVMSVLDNASGYDLGLTVAPLSWSKGDHFALTSVHAFDVAYSSTFGGWQYVQGSTTQDTDPTHI